MERSPGKGKLETGREKEREQIRSSVGGGV